MKFIIKLLALLLLVAAVGISFMLYTQYNQYLDKQVTLPSETVTFEVAKGSSLTAVAKKLEAEGILAPARDFRILAKLQKLENKVKAGEYELEQGMSPLDVLKVITEGKSLQYKLTLIDGHTFKESIERIKASPNLKHTLSDEEYVAVIKKLGGDYSNPEGLLFPDTYNFPKNTTDAEFIERSHKQLMDYLQKAWDERDPQAVIKTPYDALILASIVEKETGNEGERPMIARVFLNRLEKGMLLQTDPTVIYGMGDSYNGNIRKKDLRKDTPYNTYTRSGLTPTPIALAGKAAIDAVMHPPEGDVLYFVARGDGSGQSYFSKTLAEHNRAVKKYLKNQREARRQGAK